MATALTEDQARAGELADALDLEPITFKLMHPHPGEDAMTLAGADQMVEAYRGFLKLCLWYPGEPVVPSKAIDEVWHAHILDTAKYAADCDVLFGQLAHHFPYFGLRGPGDEARWHAAYDRTRELFSRHFGITLDGERAPACHVGGAACKADNGAICMFDESVTCEKTMEAAGGRSPGCHAAGASCDNNGRVCVKSCACDPSGASLERPRPDRAAVSMWPAASQPRGLANVPRLGTT